MLDLVRTLGVSARSGGAFERFQGLAGSFFDLGTINLSVPGFFAEIRGKFTGALAKSASGGLEHVPICSVANLARAMGEMGEMGYLRVGLDSEGPENLEDAVLSRPLALALGAEGKGLRRLTRENCDILARLDAPGPIKSLNVSNACAVALAIATMKLRAGG